MSKLPKPWATDPVSWHSKRDMDLGDLLLYGHVPETIGLQLMSVNLARRAPCWDAAWPHSEELLMRFWRTQGQAAMEMA